MADQKKTQFPVHLDSNHWPEPEWKFPNAKIGMYAKDSTPDFPPVKEAPEGTPNVLRCCSTMWASGGRACAEGWCGCRRPNDSQRRGCSTTNSIRQRCARR